MPLDIMNSPYADQMDKFGFIPANHAQPQFFPVAAYRVFDEKGHELPGYKRIVREDTGETLNVATDSYRIVTNEEAFGAFEVALQESTLDLTDMRIGTDFAANGARCFRQYLLPAHTARVGKSDIALRLIMMNSYDGSLAFRGQSGFYNFVCANTSVSGTDLASFTMRHSGGLDVPKAIAGLAKAAEQHVVESEKMKVLPLIEVSDSQARAVMESIPQPTKTLVDDLVHRWLKARDEDEVQGGANAWCLANVLTAWATHGDGDRKRVQVRYDREARVRKLMEGKVWKALVEA